MSAQIHPTAIVHPDAHIGDGTYVWHFCHIMQGATIGVNCVLGQNVMVAPNVQVGSGVKIQNNVSLYTGVMLEDEVFVGPSAVFTNVVNPRSAVVRKHAFLPTHVKKGATIGANATIVCGVIIGNYAFIGAGTVVVSDVPDFALVVGNPARQIGWMSRRGMKLRFDHEGRATCTESKEVYVFDGNTVKLAS